MFRLGKLYDDAGRKQPATRWYQAAAEQGQTIAMINLALLIKRDDREAAMAWTLRAAEEGTDRTAQYNYGVFLEEDGRLAEAEQHYRAAADMPYPAARNRLACLLWDAGRNDEAEMWFRRALEEWADSSDYPGDEDYEANTAIMFNLAGLLEEAGRPDEALDLYSQAAGRGDAEAAEEVARLSS